MKNPDGFLVGTGSFRVDSSRAIKKIRDFQIGTSLAPELLWIRAANAAGANAIRLHRSFREFTIRFDGAKLTRKFFQDPFICLIDERIAGGRHEVHIARALLRELRDKPEFITVRSDGRRLSLKGVLSGQRRISKIPEVTDEVVIRIRWSLWRSMRMSRIGSEDLNPLTRQSRAQIFIDDEPIPRMEEAPSARIRRFRKDGYCGTLWALEGAVRASSRTRSVMHASLDGVSLGTRKVKLDSAAVEAWVDSGHWKASASFNQVVAEENYQRGIEVVDLGARDLIRSEIKVQAHRALRMGSLLISAESVTEYIFRNGHLITPEEAYGISKTYGTLVVDLRRTLWLRDAMIRTAKGPKVLRALLERTPLFWNVHGKPVSARFLKRRNPNLVRYDEEAGGKRDIGDDAVWCFLGREDRRWLSRLVSSRMRRVQR